MKKISSALSLLLLTGCSFAQNNLQQGTITYDMTTHLQGKMHELLKEQSGKFHDINLPELSDDIQTTCTLRFRDGNFSVENTAKPIMKVEPGMEVEDIDGFLPGLPEHMFSSRALISLPQQQHIQENNLNGKKYYTTSPLQPATNIVYDNGTRVILGYNCNKAVVTTADQKVYTVWYAAAIPYAYSPAAGIFANIKGAVLAFEGEDQQAIATAINQARISSGSLSPDPAAKKISEAQMYDLINNLAEEKTKITRFKNGERKEVTRIVRIKR